MAEGTTEADVVVVGAGPGGSTTAAHLARAGLDVVLLEKSAFPREKVCGDGLTPRAVAQLVKLGIDTSPEAGWLRNKGLRILGGGHRLELRWPELAAYPDYGLVRRRDDFDEMLARHAQKAGARLSERTTVTGPVRDERTGAVVGVTAKGSEGEPLEVRAPVVIAADGNSSRLSLAVGRRVREDRPMAVAVRAYYTSRNDRDDWLESWLELREDGKLLPGYGWIFGMGDGTSNVGLGILNAAQGGGKVDSRDVLRRWLAALPPEYGFTEDSQVGPVRGAALPMGFNRTPHYADGLLLVGDAGGMVNPFNGEGIAYAMESGALAADVVAQALARPSGAQRERALAAYPQALKEQWGGYFTLGRMFVRLISDPRVMRVASERGLTHPLLMQFTLKLLANLTDPRGGDAIDRLINGLQKVVPRA
ncbi:geranylgeranyl reductase family protein [Motilibacter rhizosphaerae]|uniref:Geranylgeranyl reductase family protein n=1 Tax=Motilibacter rhizosphaerae TaxID=598652 RepID=A0A4Q7NA14_9ACTN|nr:geranylgeranyl reductase family protein [Motilibacter rhizosphaerae]RZS79022.1 geranylgeranyl reductase family protein [Motilibacter rhizosphaerae]